MSDYTAFVAAALDARIHLRKQDVFYLAIRITDDRLIRARRDELSAQWWDAIAPKLEAARISSKPEEPDDPAFLEIARAPDFYLQVAESLTHAEKIALRKRLGFRPS